MVILLISRVVNILLPLTLRQLVDDLDHGYGFPLLLLFTYAGLKFLNGSGGLNALRDVSLQARPWSRHSFPFCRLFGRRLCSTRIGVSDSVTVHYAIAHFISPLS